MWAVLIPILQWVLQAVVIKGITFSAVFALVAFLVPIVINWIIGFISPGGLTSAFSMVPTGIWWVLDAFSLGYGLPLIISAYVYAFLIRRLPVIG